MIVYVDNESKIRAVGSTTDESLTPLYINDDCNPFNGWSTSKICCYKVAVVDGIVTMMTPYVDSRCLEFVDQMGHQIDSVTAIKFTKTAYIDDTSVTFENIPSGNIMIQFSNPTINYSVTKDTNIVTVTFDPLTEIVDIMLSVL